MNVDHGVSLQSLANRRVLDFLCFVERLCLGVRKFTDVIKERRQMPHREVAVLIKRCRQYRSAMLLIVFLELVGIHEIFIGIGSRKGLSSFSDVLLISRVCQRCALILTMDLLISF